MRKFIANTLIIALLIATVMIVPAYADSATVTGDYVNFRSGPGMGYSVISCLRKGTSVTVTGVSGDWAAVIYNGESGYISSRYLSTVISDSSVSVPVASDDLEIPVPEEDDGARIVSSVDNGNSRTIVVVGSSDTSSGGGITYGTDSSGSQGNSNTSQNDVPATPVPTPAPTPASTPEPTPSPSSEPVSGSSAAGYISGDYVRFRTGPSTSYTILGTYNKGKALTVDGVSGEWTKCTIDGRSGYVFSQYVKKSADTVQKADSSSDSSKSSETVTATSAVTTGVTKAGYISGNNVRFRKGPSLDAEIIGEFYFANSVTITGTSGDWTAVSADGKSGFVYSQYVKEGTYSNTVSNETGSASSASGQAVVDYAMQYLGSPYKWGGKDPSGFDCSGFVYYVYSHFNVTLNRTAQDQASNGTHVDPSNLQPGDILCFYSGSNYIGHSGIYIGNGKFIHSATSTTGVIITELSGYYTSRGFEARRIVS